MRMLATGIQATAILGEASVAFAAGNTGTIKSLDPGKDTITLHNGSTYMAPKSVKFSQGRREGGHHVDEARDLTTLVVWRRDECGRRPSPAAFRFYFTMRRTSLSARLRTKWVAESSLLCLRR